MNKAFISGILGYLSPLIVIILAMFVGMLAHMVIIHYFGEFYVTAEC